MQYIADTIIGIASASLHCCPTNHTSKQRPSAWTALAGETTMVHQWHVRQRWCWVFHCSKLTCHLYKFECRLKLDNHVRQWSLTAFGPLGPRQALASTASERPTSAQLDSDVHIQVQVQATAYCGCSSARWDQFIVPAHFLVKIGEC